MMAIAERAQSEGIAFIRSGRIGVGRPLVLVHGIGSNAQSFVPLMTHLAASRPTIAWDAPGYGASTPLQPDWPSADDYADALAGLLDRLDTGKIDLLGHSLGALVAARLAAREPKRIGRLIFASPALGYHTKPGNALAPQAASRLEALIAEGAARFAATRGPRLVHARHDAALVAGVVKAMSEVKLPGYSQASRMLSCADLIGEAGILNVPTLVLVGAEDEVTPPANCKRMHYVLSVASPALGHRFEIVPDAGHALPQERPDAVARLIEAFAPAGGK